ncbi:MAG: SMC-Scp complex subunit ScpB [Alphaproteobacteria bacterium]|nr:SMC-Scp complex subunit ScpB [Alphaproteobacteria bacterium]
MQEETTEPAEEEAEIEVEIPAPEITPEDVRITEAVLFAAVEPLDANTIADKLTDGVDVKSVLQAVQEKYEASGFTLHKIGNKWAFRTASDLAHVLEKYVVQRRRLSKAALETMAIIAYHQPVTRAEIEDIRGVSVSKGVLDVLLESEWVKIRGRRRVVGRPITYGTTDGFLDHFGLEALKDLPGIEELKAAGLLDDRLPPGFIIPDPDPDNDPEEDALDADDPILRGEAGAEILPLAEDDEAPKDEEA